MNIYIIQKKTDDAGKPVAPYPVAAVMYNEVCEYPFSLHPMDVTRTPEQAKTLKAVSEIMQLTSHARKRLGIDFDKADKLNALRAAAMPAKIAPGCKLYAVVGNMGTPLVKLKAVYDAKSTGDIGGTLVEIPVYEKVDDYLKETGFDKTKVEIDHLSQAAKEILERIAPATVPQHVDHAAILARVKVR